MKEAQRFTTYRVAKPEMYIEGIVQQQGKVIRMIYDQFLPRIQRFILKNSGTEQDAQDVFQEAIMVVYANASKPDFVLSCSFYTYLHAICRNIWLRQLKEKRKLRVTFTDDWEYLNKEDFEDTLAEAEQFDLFWRKFNTLGADCQRLLRLFFDGASMQSIMQKMGYGSEGYARKRKYQCKEKLFGLITQDPEYEPIRNHES